MPTSRPASSIPEPVRSAEPRYSFHLVISGSDLSALALMNVRKFCAERLSGRYELKVSNLADDPQLARELQIAATPLLIRENPGPKRRFIGSMAQMELALIPSDLGR